MQRNWLGLTLEDTERELISRLGVTARSAPGIALKVGNFDDRIREEFQKFWKGTPFDGDIVIEGWTYIRLLKEYGFKPIGSWITLDWLCKEPAEAKSALKYGIK